MESEICMYIFNINNIFNIKNNNVYYYISFYIY